MSQNGHRWNQALQDEWLIEPDRGRSQWITLQLVRESSTHLMDHRSEEVGAPSSITGRPRA